jgi:thioredoxin-like negative regulator of GroEL
VRDYRRRPLGDNPSMAEPPPADSPPAESLPAGSPSGTWTVACLCAAWCRTCDAVRPHFEARAAAQAQLAHRWIDIEDEADALGDLDIETFPTLLVVRDGVPLFFGPVLPKPEAVDALVAALIEDPTPRAAGSIDAEQLAPLLALLATSPR